MNKPLINNNQQLKILIIILLVYNKTYPLINKIFSIQLIEMKKYKIHVNIQNN